MSAIDCITYPYLTILGDCNDESSSGVVLNHLPGVSLKTAAVAANEEYIKGIDMLRAFEQEAVREVANDILHKLSSKFQDKKVVDSLVIGKYSSTFRTPGADEWVGWELSKDYTQKGRYTKLRLDHIDLDVDEEATKDIYVKIDNADAYVFDTVAVSPDAINRVYMDLEADSKILVYWEADLDIGNDLGGISGVGYGDTCSEGCTSIGGCYEYHRIESSDGLTFTQNSSKSSGIIAFSSCICDYSYLLCRFQTEIAYAVRYKVGIMLLNEVLSSERANPVIRNTRESALRLLARWEGTPDPNTGFDNKSEYWREIGKVSTYIKTIIEREKNICFNCQGVKVVYNLP